MGIPAWQQALARRQAPYGCWLISPAPRREDTLRTTNTMLPGACLGMLALAMMTLDWMGWYVPGLWHAHGPGAEVLIGYAPGRGYLITAPFHVPKRVTSIAREPGALLEPHSTLPACWTERLTSRQLNHEPWWQHSPSRTRHSNVQGFAAQPRAPSRHQREARHPLPSDLRAFH